MKMFFLNRIDSIRTDGWTRAELQSGIGCSLRSGLEGGAAPGESRWPEIVSIPPHPSRPLPLLSCHLTLFFSFLLEGQRKLMSCSLATVEMKILLREVYSRYRTTVAADMTGCMDIDDQIISARPKGQACRLTFTARE